MSEPIYLYCSNPEQYQNLRDELKAIALQASRRSAGHAGSVLMAVLRSLVGAGSIDLSSVLSLGLEQRLIVNAAIGSCLSVPLSETEKANLVKWLDVSSRGSKVV